MLGSMLAQTIRISVRTIADYMTSSPSVQRRIVGTNKYPSDDEAKAIVTYYREARSAVEQFFTVGQGHAVIATAIDRLASQSDGANAQRKVRLGRMCALWQTFKNPFSRVRFSAL